MYRSFYNLIRKPFMQAGDPAFFWIGGRRAVIFEEMYNCILENCGLLLLTGDKGIGKTATLQALDRSLQGEAVSGVISGPIKDRIDCYNAIARTFALDREFASKVQFLLYFAQFLHESKVKKKVVLLAVDDCHSLSQDLMEELRAISNIRNDDGSRLITIIMAGEPEFLKLLDHPSNMVMRQQVAIENDLKPLDSSEVTEYIAHRLKAAGGRQQLFSEEAIQLLCRLSAGKPSEINRLCERALILGAHAGKREIESQTVEDATDPANLARVSQHVDKTVKVEGECGQKGFRDFLRTDNVQITLRQLFQKYKNNFNVKLWGTLGLFAALCILYFNLPSTRQIVHRPDASSQDEPSNISTSSSAAGPAYAVKESDKKRTKDTASKVSGKDFWQSREDESRLIKIDLQAIEGFIKNFQPSPDSIFLLRSGDSTLSEKRVHDIQRLLVLHGVGPAQVKVMKPTEKDFIDAIAATARREGHKVFEGIVVEDGIWWGELGDKTSNH